MSVVIHFLWLKNLTAVQISRELDEIYGQAALSLRTVERWLARFAAGGKSNGMSYGLRK
jgi:hypothetical protein